MTVRWPLLGVATALGAIAATAAELPAPALLAGVFAGLGYALVARVRLRPPRQVSIGAQTLIGASIGAHFEAATIGSVGEHWLAVGLVIAGTLAVSLLAGIVVASVTGLDRSTALLGLLAGGASGIVTMSREIGGDERLVAFMQYLRVFTVVLLAPLLVAVAVPGGGGGGASPRGPEEDAGLLADALFTAIACGAGLLAAHTLPIPAAALLGSLAVAAALELGGVTGGGTVPPIAADIAFATIGVQVGLRFTVAQLRDARRILPAVLAAIAGVVAACAGFAALLASLAGVPFLDAYLATTPGGMPAVLATAAGTQADTTFVLAVQTLRLLVMVAAAPPLVRALARRPPRLQQARR
jgi:membrane AbrB-like protein